MEKEKHNSNSPAKELKKKPVKKESPKPNQIHNQDVEHGDIDYDPADPHGLKTKSSDKKENK